MGRLYSIYCNGLYTDDINKKGKWKSIKIQEGKGTNNIYTRDKLELNQNFITIKTIEDIDITIGTKFIVTIKTINIKYDENGKFGEKNWRDRNWIGKW